MSLENKYYYFSKSDSIITIKYKSSQEFQYIAENAETFVNYLSNIGGLISLWFGLAFVDIETIFKFLVRRIRFFLIHTIRLDKIIEIIKSMLMRQLLIKLIHLVHYLEKYNWGKMLSIICFPIFTLQIYLLIDSYLKFSTEVSVDLIQYRDFNDMISLDTLPAITVCVEDIFESLVNEKKTISLFTKLDSQLFNHTLYDDQFYEIPYNIYEVNRSNNNMALQYSLHKALIYRNLEWLNYFKRKYQHEPDGWDLIYDMAKHFQYKHLHLFNEEDSDRQLSMKYWQTLARSQTDMLSDGFCELALAMQRKLDFQMKYCQHLYKIPYIVSPFGKCFTFFYNNQTNQTKEMFRKYRFNTNYLSNLQTVGSLDLYVDDYNIDYVTVKPYQQKFIVHQAISFPTVSDYDMSFTQNNLVDETSFVILLKKVFFERLEPPYDTDCVDYGNTTLFDCLNNCYRDKYLKEFNCIPLDEGLYTINFDSSNENIYCPNIESVNVSNIYILSQKLKYECSKNCGTPCSEVYYSSDYHEIQSNFLTQYKFFLGSSYYLKVKYWPKTLFYSLIIDLANTWSLWYGISLIQIIDILSTSYTKKLFHFIIKKLNQPQLFIKLKVRKF